MKTKKYWLFIMVFALVTSVFMLAGEQWQVSPTVKLSDILNDNLETELVGKYYTLKDEDGKMITATALPVFAGDEYIAEDNKHYKVVKVQGTIALCKFMGVDRFAYNPAWDEPAVLPTATGGNAKAKIGVYHTHTDESYVPTDGKASIYGRGGIFKVGNVYADAMRNQGINVVHSTRPHDPHDPNAYHRSRRTAVELLRQNPAALVDVHRDAVPAEVYRKNVQGKEVTQIKMVVGRRNPKMAENLKFAQNIKSYVDKNKPGLIEGIFIAKGSYNQDLSPRAMLIEVGSHTNSRIEAEKGITLFSEAIPRVSGVSATTAPGTTPGNTTPGANATQNRSSWSTLIWIVLAVILGVGAFLLISTGSLSESWKKVRSFKSEEFANAFFRRKQDKRKK